MIKKAVLLFLFIVSVSFAASFDVSVSRESISVPAGSSGYFEFNITSENNDTFAVTVDGRLWMTMSDIRPGVGPDKHERVFLYANPGIAVVPGSYRVNVIFKSLTNDQSDEKRLYVSVTHEKKVAIEKVTVSGSLEPSGTVEVRAFLRNFEDVTVSDISVKGDVSSSSEVLATINEIVNEINPGQTAEVRKMVTIPSQAQPGRYMVNIQVSYGNRTEAFVQSFTIGSTEKFEKTVSEFLVFVGHGREIAVVNNGNLPGSITVHGDAGWFYAGPAPSKIDGKTYYWELTNVQPGEKRTIRYEINYLPLIILVLLLAVLLWILMFKIMTLRIRKFIMQKKHIHEGTEFTVGIDLMNSSGKNLKNVVVMDFVPPVFLVKDAPGFSPTKKKGHAGTHLTWKFDNFGKSEERILSYKIVPLIGVSGEVALPKAHVQFKSGARSIKNSSLVTTLGVQPEREARKTFK